MHGGRKDGGAGGMSATPDTVKAKDTLSIEIDGVPLQARRGQMVIEAADAAGITIPRFCYHKKLSIAANCRMCLVEVEKVPKPLPACATPVTEGMKVFTRSPKALEAQKGTMEFLLINHPLDCPICDQGGECELQELSIGYGEDHSKYRENKRVVKDKDIGPLIATEMTRCIHCTRCVRFGDEIAGLRELGATGRGENMRIGTYIETAVTSEMSGNVIDLCPVGALTSKPFRFTARAWEMTPHASIAPHDCIGSSVTVWTRGNQVMRVDPRENEAINEVWISDRDRFSYEALNEPGRLLSPRIKRDGHWQDADWTTALQFAVEGLRATLGKHGASQLGTLVSPSATVEEALLAQKVTRGLGSAHVDHRLRQIDVHGQETMPVFPSLGLAIDEVQGLDAALLIGSHVRKDQPILAHRLRQAALRGAKVMFVNPLNYEFNFPVHRNIAAAPHLMEAQLAGVVRGLLDIGERPVPRELAPLLEKVVADADQIEIARSLLGGQRRAVLVGTQAHMHPAFASLRALAGAIAELSGASFGYLTEGANGAGAWLAGAVPHRAVGGATVAAPGMSATEMLRAALKAYLLVGVEPELDTALGAIAGDAMRSAEWVVALTPFRSEFLEAYSNVMLPVSPFTETSGTFVNAEGRWQSFGGAVTSPGDARPGWKVLRVFGNLLDLQGFDYVSSEEVRDEVHGLAPPESARDDWRAAVPVARSANTGDTLIRVADVPIYAGDGIVRRAPALQATVDAQTAAVSLSDATAQRLGLSTGVRVTVRQGNHSIALPVEIDPRVPEGCAYIPVGLAEATHLGEGYGPVTIGSQAT